MVYLGGKNVEDGKKGRFWRYGSYMKPDEYGLHHEEWREHQKDSVRWAMDSKIEKISILEAPTGSGKTAIAKAIGSKLRVISLVQTKVLQVENYEADYGFDVLFGRGNYECVHPTAHKWTMADECIFAEVGMNKCGVHSECPYIIAREAAKQSSLASLNYPYWLHTYHKWPLPNVLVCDEGHELPEIVLDWAGCTVNNKTRLEFDLPMFPVIRTNPGQSIRMEVKNSQEKAYEWCNEALIVLRGKYAYFSNSASTNKEHRKALRKVELLGKKILSTAEALQIGSEGSWYIRSGPPQDGERSLSNWKFVCRPLTARYHFPLYFTGNYSTFIMSATIGNFDTFAAEIGADNFRSLCVPSVWPASTRPVYKLDVPGIGRKSTPAAWKKQAEEIANAINMCDPSWSGIIHTNSIVEAGRLAERLARLGLQDRIYVSERKPTNVMMDEWQRQLQNKPNSILVSWAFWQGYNGLDEKIDIVAKIPYPFLGDPYEKARMMHDGKLFLQRAAWKLEQGAGRTRRGRPEDYDTDEGRAGMVAVADGNVTRVRNYLSAAMRESLTEL